MKTYKCPVCGGELSKEHYQHALGIVDAQKKAIEAERAEIGKLTGLKSHTGFRTGLPWQSVLRFLLLASDSSVGS